ncbi:pimeloyl-ACP methyl ester carboxylesterase [Fluviicoccus keumensis]|uniref:Pimeloyl-ACP methyl ester carboxylesterase n=2 Tax=Fluviicoccus keumensis TaxID=1435465 RepID=A0A4Q7ZD87_9GAMM|nr:pimeloyl-ACP methyl ester carboxylesterase [Fluviicoccus keumensis]
MSERTPPTHLYLNIRGLHLHVAFWPGDGDPLLLLHATGFHARCWDEIVRRLPGRPVFAVDLPCHGGSDAVRPPPGWDETSEMITEVVRQLDLRNITAAGHSFGGHILVQTAARETARFRSLLLLDPVIPPPEFLPLWQAAGSFEPVSRRRNAWASPEEMAEAFRTRIPYDTWDAAVLRDYCQYGLVKEEGAEHYRLACPPDCEAAVYGNIGAQTVYELLPRVTVPVRIIRARGRRPDDRLHDFRPSPTWAELASKLPQATDRQLPEQDHFFPMSDPGLVARELGELLSLPLAP